VYRFVALMFSYDTSLVHPDDLVPLQKRITAKGNYFFNFEEVERGGLYRVLLIEGEPYRVKHAAIREYTPSKFSIGQRVWTTSGPKHEGWIRQIMWHFKSHCHHYYLEIEQVTGGRKKVSRRYLEGDLEARE
jgi:hypothetical protein